MKQAREEGGTSLVATQRPLESLSCCTSAMEDMEMVARARGGLATTLRRARGGQGRWRGQRCRLKEGRVAMAI